MRICLVSNYSGRLDEGAGNVAHHLHRELSYRHEVLHLVVKDVFSSNFWRSVRIFDPDIIHYVGAHSIISFMLAKLLKSRCSRSKTIMSPTTPILSLFTGRFIRYFRPDLVLTLSNQTERMMRAFGCRTMFLPFGVETSIFTPVTSEKKMELRRRYGLHPECFIVLHVGPIVQGRGVKVFERLCKKDTRVLLVASTTLKPDQHLIKNLRDAGCIVWYRYIPNIEDIYKLSDCYIFPVQGQLFGTVDTFLSTLKINLAYLVSGGSVQVNTQRQWYASEIPLSVLEALSCNLPVISTRFGALPKLFEQGDGFFFVDEEQEIGPMLEIVKRGIDVKTREKVLSLSWKNVTSMLERIYERVQSDCEGECF